MVGEYFDFAQAVVASCFDGSADAWQIDDAIAHHAAIVQQVLRRHQPVANVMGEQPAFAAGALDAGLKVGSHQT